MLTSILQLQLKKVIRSKEQGVSMVGNILSYPPASATKDEPSALTPCSFLLTPYFIDCGRCVRQSSLKGEAVSQPLPQEDNIRFLSKRKGFRFSFAARPSRNVRPSRSADGVRSLLVVHELTRIFTNTNQFVRIRENSWTTHRGLSPQPTGACPHKLGATSFRWVRPNFPPSRPRSACPHHMHQEASA